MRYAFIIICSCFLFSCSDSFINHELKAERIGDCSQQPSPIKMISNINGERYEFEYCLDEGFDGKKYAVDRKGDSLIVSFARPTTKTALFKLILDIDAKPAYHYILLGDQMLEIVPTER